MGMITCRIKTSQLRRVLYTDVVKSTSLSLCSCSVSVIVINQNCQKQGKLCKLFLHMPSTEFAHAQLRVNRVCTCSVKGKHDTKPSFLG